MYDGYYQPGSMATPGDDPGSPFDMPDDAKSAALSVAFVLAMGTVVLALLRRANFRAVIGVGR